MASPCSLQTQPALCSLNSNGSAHTNGFLPITTFSMSLAFPGYTAFPLYNLSSDPPLSLGCQSGKCRALGVKLEGSQLWASGLDLLEGEWRGSIVAIANPFYSEGEIARTSILFDLM
eukprot:Gb_40857 [translate_table: standard]